MTERQREQHDLFMNLFLEHEDALRGFVRALVPTREDTRDVMQDVAAVLWRKFSELDSPEGFRRWAFGVARLQALAWVRDHARDRHCFSADLLNIIAHDIAEFTEELERERDALEDCLAKLPQSQRLLLTDAYAPKAQINKIAALCGRTSMSIYKELHRIRLMLLGCVRRTLGSDSTIRGN